MPTAPRTLQLPTGATQEEKEKILQKLYINFGVLTRLGYSEEKVVKVSFMSLSLKSLVPFDMLTL